MTGFIEVKTTLMEFRKSKKLSTEDFCKGLSVSADEYLEFEVSGKLPVTTLIEIYKKYGYNLIARKEQKPPQDRSL